MTCPPRLAPIIVELIRIGLLRVRSLAWSGNQIRCAIEADHIHNLPRLLTDFSIDQLEAYWEKDRPTYRVRVTPDELNAWEDLWSAMRAHVEVIRRTEGHRENGNIRD